MAKMSDLGLGAEQVGQALDYASMPDQFGTIQDPLYPGTYLFEFPKRVDDIWEKFDHLKGNPPGTRIRAKFDDSHSLLIIQSPGGTRDNEPHTCSMSNAEFKRGKAEDAAAPWISDLDYIFRDVFGLPGKPAGNMGYINTFQQHAVVNGVPARFLSDVNWSWNCGSQRNIYVANGQGGYQEVQQLGCGTSYRQRDVQKVASDPGNPHSPLVFPLRITCQCGAAVRAFANLGNFRKST